MNKISILLFSLLFGFSDAIFAAGLTLKSSAFSPNTTIPSQYTCNGADQSPPLSWQDSLNTTQSYVLIVDDPDSPSGIWNHWIVFNIPSRIKQLAEGGKIPSEAVTIKNSWNKTNYIGPCPPSGVHRYFFRLYALDTSLNLTNSATMEELLQAMKGHIIANAELIGLYRKQ